MADMSIAHFGTTLMESPPAEGEDQASIPMTGDLSRTDEFLRILGAEVYIKNMYPGVGRQYIYRRGTPNDPDYFEKDTFTSYVAERVPDPGAPRVGETIFRLPHPDAIDVAKTLMEAGLIAPRSSWDEFVAGRSDRLLFEGPDLQRYELSQSTGVRAENHRVYIWTDTAELQSHKTGYAEEFGIHFAGTEPFYNLGTAHLLHRDDPGITIALVTREEPLSPKHSFDIFKDAGYSHFRLGSPNKERVLQVSEEAFPDGGGPVSYVHFQNSYLELVQVGQKI